MNKLTSNCIAADLGHVWHPFTQHSYWNEDEIVVIDRAEGCLLYDTEGREYLDGVSSLWVNAHGHRHPAIDEAVRGQLDRIAHSTFLGLSNVPASLLARELVAIAPEGLSRVFYSDSGAEAVEIAIKMAFQYFHQNGSAQRNKFLALCDAYHGDTLGSVSLGGMSTFHSIYKPLLFDVVRVRTPHCYRCEHGTGDLCRKQCFDELTEAFGQFGNQLAAAVIEPRIQGAAGMIVHPEGYLRHFEKLCREHGVFLVADEVATGFGRTGTMFSCDAEDVKPDFLCLGKCITGGYLPLAATLASERVFEGFLGTSDSNRAFLHGHSYTGNQLASAAALANLKVFRDEDVLTRVGEISARMDELLQRFSSLPFVGDIRKRGVMVGIELVQDKKNKIPFSPSRRTGHSVIRAARRNGAILRPLGDVVVLMPQLSISNSQLDRLLTIAYNSICEVV